MREALAKSSTRVMDLLLSWDDGTATADGAAALTKRAFRRGMRRVGLDASDEDLDGLFEQMDVDGSGFISFKELHRMMRHAGVSKLSLPTKDRTVAGSVRKKQQAALKAALAGSLTKVSDHFSEWDTNADGAISREEFVGGVHGLGLSVPTYAIEAEFDEFDADGDGAIVYSEYVLHVLREALAASASRVVDLFHRWSDGTLVMVDRKAFRRGLRGVGFAASDADMDLVFDEMDSKRAGFLLYQDLDRLLRRGGASKLLVEAFENRGPTTDLGQEQRAALKAALAGSISKVRDRFRSWDVQGAGVVDRAAFVRGVMSLGLEVSPTIARTSVSQAV